MKGLPADAIVIESGPNYCWVVTCSDDRRKLHIDLWVLQGEDWDRVVGSGFGFDRAMTLKFSPILQAFLAPAPEVR